MSAADDSATFYYLLWQNRVTGDRAVWPMEGASRLGGALLLPREHPEWEMVGGSDFDGDGVDDILFQNTRTGQRGLWRMYGHRFRAWIPFSPEDTAWRMVAAGPFDAGAHSDILWENRRSGERGLWIMNRTAFSEWLPLPQEAPSWRMVGAADFTRDGRPDMLLQNSTTGERGIWELDGARWVNWTSFTTEDPLWEMVSVHDVNGDGHPDILFQHVTSGARGWWIMEGTQYRGWVPLGTVPAEWDLVGALRSLDATAPVVHSTTFTSRHVDVRLGQATVGVVARIGDAAPGVRGMTVEMYRASDAAVLSSCSTELPRGTMIEEATLACDLIIEADTPQDVYFTRLKTWDLLGNAREVATGTISLDITPPVLESFTMDARYVDVTHFYPHHIWFTAQARDDVSERVYLVLTIRDPYGTPTSSHLTNGVPYWHSILRSVPSGTYLVSVTVYDETGNVREYTTDQLALAGFPNSYIVTRD